MSDGIQIPCKNWAFGTSVNFTGEYGIPMLNNARGSYSHHARNHKKVLDVLAWGEFIDDSDSDGKIDNADMV